MSNTYPGNYAVPGSVQPGSCVPGTPLSDNLPLMYIGQEQRNFPNYLAVDLTTGATGSLVAIPGHTYSIQPVGGDFVDMTAVPVHQPSLGPAPGYIPSTWPRGVPVPPLVLYYWPPWFVPALPD